MSLRPSRVLLIDDSPEDIELILEKIHPEENDLLVEAVHSAEEGLVHVRRNDYDVVLCDFKLPGISGLTFIKLAMETRPNTPVVLLTGYGTEELEHRAERESVYAFLRKPVERELLQRIIQDALAYRERLELSSVRS